MADLMGDIIKKINRANDIALYCHTNPDGDALGSMLALFHALKKKGKDMVAYCDTPVPEKYQYLPGASEIQFPQKRTHELAISLDSSDLDRLGQCMKSYLSARYQIAIDHHKSFARFADLCLVDSSAAACAQIVYKLIKEMKLLDDKIAMLIFSGVVTDSGCFAFSSVTKETHQIACELMGYDFDKAQAIYDAYRKTTHNRFMLKTRVLSKAKFFADNQIGLIVFSNEDFNATNTSTEHTEGIVSELIDIDSVKVAYAISQVGDKNFKLSIRTKDVVDAAEIASLYGGGGHRNAAGCRINGYLEDIVERLVKIANDRI